MKTSTAIQSARTLTQIVKIINDEIYDYGFGMAAEELAAQYAFEAADESGYTVTKEALECHLDVLTVSGALFNEKFSLEIAMSEIS